MLGGMERSMTYTLQTAASVAECSDRGGELISFVTDGIEYVWDGDPKYWSGQAPHLFPAVCSSLNGHVTYDGVEYPMPKHGIVRGEVFRVVELAPDFIIFEHKWSEETLKYYPAKYTLRVAHRLSENGFSTTYTVTSENDAVFCLGGHPAFRCPLPEGGTFEDYVLRFRDAAGAVMSVTKNGYMDQSVPKLHRIKDNVLPLKYSDFDEDAMIIENLPSKVVDLVSTVDNHGFRFRFKGFDALGIWTPIGLKAPFVCLEPWCGLPADVRESGLAEDKKYAKKISAGEEFTVGYSISII